MLKLHYKSYKHVLSISTLLLAFIFAGCTTMEPATETGSQTTEEDQTEAADTDRPVDYQQLERPVPNSVEPEIPQSYLRAIEEETRTEEGAPGEAYWQQRSKYVMDVELDPESKMVEGKGTITYYNNSPDDLEQLVLELAQNMHDEGAARKEQAEVTGGMDIHSISLEGEELDEVNQMGQTGYAVNATRLVLLPDEALASGDSITIEAEWSFEVPSAGISGRMGHDSENLFYIGYWYPHMAVYDDVNGWFADVFLGNAEFYHGFADYDVNITAPEQWLVRATGENHNLEELLESPVYERYQEATESDEVVHIITEEDFGNFTNSGEDGKLTWEFTADDVIDFAFSVTKESMWDGARTSAGDRDNDGEDEYTFVDALYRDTAPKWTETAEYAQHSITFLSEHLGLPYPWSHMTSVEGGGIIGGGMEFPMMTVIGTYNQAPQEALYSVVVHEFAHMWSPMIASSNERRYSWIDEGLTSFNENQARKDYYEDSTPDRDEFRGYLNIAGSEYEGEMMRWSDYHYPGPGFGVASYAKPASVLVALRGVLGEETFNEALQAYFDRWKYKHPYPQDLFNTFEDVSGEDLGWFWRSWYYETWVLDQAIGEVEETESGTRIVIKDHGEIPMPADVEITLDNGSTLTRAIDVETWLRGATEATLEIEEEAEVTKVVIDPDHTFPDIDRSNNTWEAD